MTFPKSRSSKFESMMSCLVAFYSTVIIIHVAYPINHVLCNKLACACEPIMEILERRYDGIRSTYVWGEKRSSK